MKNIYKKTYDDIKISADFKERTKALIGEASEPKTDKDKKRRFTPRLAFGALALILVAVIGTSAALKVLAPKSAGKESACDSAVREDNSAGGMQVFSSYDELGEYCISSQNNFLSSDKGFIEGDRNLPFPGSEEAQEQGNGVLTEGGSGDETLYASEYGGAGLSGDIVKTDGDYIYYAANQTIYIFAADGADSEKTAEINISQTDGEYEYYYLRCIYLNGDTLIAAADSGMYSGGIYRAQTDTAREKTVLLFYDISDRYNPVFSAVAGQDGFYTNSYMKDGYLYTVTDYGVYGDISKDERDSFVPRVYEGGSMKCVDIENIFAGGDTSELRYTITVSYDVSNRSVVSSTALLGGGNEAYISDTAIYISGKIYRDEVREAYTQDNCEVTEHCIMTYTSLVKISAKGGILTFEAYSEFYGSLFDASSLDEYGGFLRAAVTVNDDNFRELKYSDGRLETEVSCGGEENNIYVFDDNLNMTGSLENILPKGQIYGLCFLDESVYISGYDGTYRLLCIDVAYGNAPSVVSEIETDCAYPVLKRYDGSVLVGLGTVAGDISRVKFAMFDISDKNTINEIQFHIINSSYSSALDDSGALTLCPEKSAFAFPTEENYIVGDGSNTKGWYLLKKLPASVYGGTRGLFIEDIFYIIDAGGFRAYDTEEYNLLCKYEY